MSDQWSDILKTYHLSSCPVPVEPCTCRMGEVIKGVAQLEAIVNLAHQWSAGYPLGGGMDEVASKDIYEQCVALGGE